MADTVERIRKLIELAIDDRTPIEEARTAGITACRMIVKHQIELIDGLKAAKGESFDLGSFFDGVEIVETSRRWPEAGPTPRGRPAKKEKSNSGQRMITAQSAGFCAVCNDTYAKGDRVVWLSGRRQIVHGDCFHGRGRRPDLS